jgi:hypothetical protein
MLKPWTILVAAALVGFIAVLVLPKTAFDATGLLQRPLGEPIVTAASDGATGVAVQFVVEQCEPSLQIAELATNAGTTALDMLSKIAPIAERNNTVPAAEPKLEGMTSSQSFIEVPQIIEISPSILYLR